MTRWICATVAEMVLSGFAFLLLTGQYVNEGHVVVILTRDHGLHSGDFFVLGGWAVATAALLALVLPHRAPARIGAAAGAGRPPGE